MRQEAKGIAFCLEACAKSRGWDGQPPSLATQICQTPPCVLRACRGPREPCGILSRDATGAPEAWGSPPCCGSGHTSESLSLSFLAPSQDSSLPWDSLYLGNAAGRTVISQAPQICEMGVTFPVFLLPSPSWAVLRSRCTNGG